VKLLVLSCAETEIAEAVDYYNKQRPGLGYEFAVEMQRSFERIRNHPNAWAPFSTRSRRCLTDRFPYGILYQIRAESIIVGAVMHLRQDPRYWEDREQKSFDG